MARLLTPLVVVATGVADAMQGIVSDSCSCLRTFVFGRAQRTGGVVTAAILLRTASRELERTVACMEIAWSSSRSQCAIALHCQT